MKKLLIGPTILAILSGCATNPLENPTIYSCIKYYDDGEIETAQAVCDKVSSTGNQKSYYYLSKIEQEKGNELKSIDLLSRAGQAYKPEFDKFEKELLSKALTENKKKNYEQSREIFETLARLNNTRAQRELGNIFYYGWGVKKNKDKAVDWFSIASKSGDKYSKNSVEHIFKNKYQEGLKFYKKSQFKEATNVLEPIAKKGHYDAQGYLGDIYRLGKLGKIDYQKAFYWYELAAEQGGAYESYQLAILLKDGKGTSKNEKLSFKYFKQSANKGYDKAFFYVGYFYSEGMGVTKDLVAARKWYEKGLKTSNSSSIQNNLGLMYQRGEGGPHDLDKAMKLFKLAADSGSKTAISNIKDLENIKATKSKHANSPKLFDVKLYGATRSEMRSAIKRAGAKPLREKLNYFADEYDSKEVMPGSSKMFVFYSLESDRVTYGSDDDFLAQVRYEFPTSNKWYVDEIKELLINKYGNPDYSSGSANLGSVTHSWYKDGVTIRLKRDWPNLDLKLLYNISHFKNKMDAEIKALKEAEKFKKYKNSESSF